jgi:EmrB/QacA subfamily drug resistance transporter
MNVRSEPQAPSVTGFRQSLLALLGVALGLMLSGLDQTIIGNVLPSIVADLGGFSLYAWVATGYLLASVISIPVFGRLGDYFGRKYFVLAAVLIFSLASLLCGFASSMAWLLAARVLQGLGGGVLIGTAFACVPELFPETARRLRWQMLLSMLFSTVNAVGPTLGGWLSQSYGWRAVFFLNIPLGFLSVYFIWRHLPYFPPAAALRRGRIDWLGALLIALALGGLQLFVQFLSRGGAGLVCAGSGVLSLLAFCLLLWWERRCVDPLLPTELFRDKSIRGLFILSVLAGAIMFVLLFYLPLLFQGAYGLQPKQAGFLITPLALCITLGAIVNGRIIMRVRNPNHVPLWGFVVLMISCASLAALGRTASFNTLLALMFGAGTGLGFILMNLTLFTQCLAERQHLGIATALLQSLRLVGGMLGTALAGSLVTVLYRIGIAGDFERSGAAEQLAPFADPRILLNAQEQIVQIKHLSAAGHNGLLLMEQVRDALARAIDVGLLLAAVLALMAVWGMARLAQVSLHDRR